MDVVVVGAGLAGLTAAATLHDGGYSVTVVEARASVGGRIRTIVPEVAGEGSWLDLGATWHWANQAGMRELAASLGMATFPQFRDGAGVVEDPDAPPRTIELPPPSPTELRFTGGTQQLCHRLAARLPEGAVLLEREVTTVAADGAGVTVSVADARRAGAESHLPCAFVVVAVPPRLAWAGIAFDPALPDHLGDVMQGTPTWMGTALKVAAVYPEPFWRGTGCSGLAFSRVGPLIEVHDACTPDASTAALWGFVSTHHDFRDLEPAARTDRVFAHLGRLFGPEAADPLQYVERDWSNDPYTNDEVVWLDDQLDLGHPAFAEPVFDGRLVWAGTETIPFGLGGGHMEGAVRSGRRAAAQVLAQA